MLHSIDNSIAGNVYSFCFLTLSKKVVAAERRRCKVILAYDAYSFTVEFFRIRAVDVIGAKPSLHVSHGNLLIKACKCSDEGGRRITVNENNVRFYFVEDITYSIQNISRNIKQGLAGLHDGKVVIRHYTERIENHVQHLTVLRRNADDGLNCLACLQLIDERTHLDCFGSCTEDEHYFFHDRISF